MMRRQGLADDLTEEEAARRRIECVNAAIGDDGAGADPALSARSGSGVGAPGDEMAHGVQARRAGSQAVLEQLFSEGAVGRQEHIERCAVAHLRGELAGGTVDDLDARATVRSAKCLERLVERKAQVGGGGDRQ